MARNEPRGRRRLSNKERETATSHCSRSHSTGQGRWTTAESFVGYCGGRNGDTIPSASPYSFSGSQSTGLIEWWEALRRERPKIDAMERTVRRSNEISP